MRTKVWSHLSFFSLSLIPSPSLLLLHAVVVVAAWKTKRLNVLKVDGLFHYSLYLYSNGCARSEIARNDANRAASKRSKETRSMTKLTYNRKCVCADVLLFYGRNVISTMMTHCNLQSVTMATQRERGYHSGCLCSKRLFHFTS